MSNNTTQSSDMIRASVSSIYSDLLRKRTIEREQKEEMKRLKREERQQREAEKKEEKLENMTKAERRRAEIDTWKEIVIGLTGDDLDYVDDKKPKKKYRKWIDDDSQTGVKSDTVKKPKKKNYQKEFAPELNMLKNLVAEQNRFSADLLKRLQFAAGPATKDAAPPNKTIVELISTINASRANALGMLREIGNLKKTMADLYMKQRKLDADLHGAAGVSDTDLALMGSSIASTLFGDDAPSPQQQSYQPYVAPSMMSPQARAEAASQTNESSTDVYATSTSTFDPSTWEGPSFDANTRSVLYENIPHEVVVEWHKDSGEARFKAVRNDTGEELVGAPVPTTDPSRLTFNETDMKVKGQFDEIYKLEIV